MTEEMLALFLYGYNEIEAKVIKDVYSSAFNREVLLFSATNESAIIDDLISFEAKPAFEDKSPKILMFLGFDENNIGLAVKSFPADEATPPIMCTLTQTNRFWPLSELIVHLLDEEKNWKDQQAQAAKKTGEK